MKRRILRIIQRLNGAPLPESVLIDSVQIVTHPRPTIAEVQTAIRQLEEDGYITGVCEHLDPEKRLWSLTPRGEIEASAP